MSEQRKSVDRAETDERNSFLELAAYSSEQRSYSASAGPSRRVYPTQQVVGHLLELSEDKVHLAHRLLLSILPLNLSF